MSYQFQAPFFRSIYVGMPRRWDVGDPAEKFDIGMLQTMLRFCGQNDGIPAMANVAVDGVMGTGTENAIKAYQDFANIRSSITAYGTFDECTSFYLNNRVNYLGGLPGYNPGTITQAYVSQDRWYGVMTPTQIVIHWTGNGNVGSTAESNRNYFATNTTKYGAQFYIDDHSIYQAAPSNQITAHCNGENGYSIGIEMCVNAGGNWFETERATVQLVKQLKSQYNITSIKKHSACSGASTDCPYPYNGDNSYWNAFLAKTN